jgi:predicted dehydrogenase
MLDGACPSIRFTHVCEPWFLGDGVNSSKEFSEWQSSVEKSSNVEFHQSLATVPAPDGSCNRMAIISGRTSANPTLLKQAVAAGCKGIYLEKPGAPTVDELVDMKRYAMDNGVGVFMGYNKNICKYVQRIRNYAEVHAAEGSTVTFVSNNAYENTDESLGECFERNSEGMLKNMAIHELALLVTFYDVTVENIESVVADKLFSSCQTLPGPSGEMWTDFDKIKFTVTTKTGVTVSVQADRCGGSDSYATVNASDGEQLFRYDMPDADDRVEVKALEAKYPAGTMPYFLAQDKDYITLKERVASFVAGNSEEAEGVASIDVAVETLRVAEFLTPELEKQLR